MNSMAQGKSEYLRALPLWAAVVPLVTINVCYVLGVSLDHLPACIPYLSGCTSVSSTGRIAPESLISKVGLLSSSVILALLWLRCATFLQLGGQTPSLWNITQTAPYFRDGSSQDLRSTVKQHIRELQQVALESRQQLRNGRQMLSAVARITAPMEIRKKWGKNGPPLPDDLDDEEFGDLMAFLRALGP